MRFKEFTNETIKTTLGKIADYKKGPFGSALKKNIFVPKNNETIKVYEQQNAINKDYRLERYFITKEYSKTMHSFFVGPGDFIVSCAGTIGEIYELPKEAPVGVINQALMRVRVYEKTANKEWFKFAFLKMISEFSSKYSNGSAIKNIPPFSDLKSYSIYLPAIEEQRKIASLLSAIEEQIEVQNKIINELSSLSSSIKTIVFSRWIHCPKIAIAHVVKEYDEKTVTDDMYPVLSSTSSGLYLQTDYFTKNASSDCTIGYKIVPFGYCTYRSMSDTGNFNFNKQNIIQNGLVSPAYPVFLVEKCSTDFLLELLNNNDEIKKQILRLKSGGTRFSLSFKKLSELKIPWPDQKKREQATRLFDSVNKQLVNERMLLKSLKREKNFLLRNLFI